MDDQDDHNSVIAVRIDKLITTCANLSDSNPHMVITHKFNYMVITHKFNCLHKKKILFIESFDSLSGELDNDCLLEQYHNQLQDLKRELSDTSNSLLFSNLEENDSTVELQTKLNKSLFDCFLSIRKSLKVSDLGSNSVASKGVKLPKLDVPTFDGNVNNTWKTFWEQFSVSIHNRVDIETSLPPSNIEE